MELMSPAGNYSSFKAALTSGADAIYMGLSLFNARKPAKNFGFTELEGIVREAHSKNSKIYITLNIDLKSNELLDAVKILTLLKKVKVDAVIVKDLAIVYFINKFFPKLEIHLSTQFGIANSKAMEAAGDLLKAERVVLARELNYNEIKALDRENYPEREIFIQGSMCFSFSGRCLMSSWNGGKSANRGSCQAPCRFIYNKNSEEAPESYFSMKDLSLAEKIDELKELNISALKIEGRLKSSDWVGEVTSIYRKMLDHNSEPDLKILQKYSGRELAEGFYGGLNNLTSEQRIKHESFAGNKTSSTSIGKAKFDLSISHQDSTIKIDIYSDYGNIELLVPHKWVIKEKRAVEISLLESKVSSTSFGGLFLNNFNIEEDFLVSKSQLKGIVSEIGSKLAPLANKERKFLKGIQIATEIESEFKVTNFESPNKMPIEFKNATTLRITANDIKSVINEINNSSVTRVIVDNCTFADIVLIQDLAKIVPIEISLFPILFEDDLSKTVKIIKVLERIKNISYEINDIGHLTLLKNTGKNINGGPSFAPYNHISANFMKSFGLSKVHIPLEADRETIKGLSLSENKLRFTLYSKIPLFYTRAKEEKFNHGDSFTDSHEKTTVLMKNNNISTFYSNEYYSAHGADLSDFLVNELIIDLSNETDILNKFEKLKRSPQSFKGDNFNLGRRLS
ncbi:MAG: U32 family peptidase [Candidatus Delongbacteria bacterium]|jgi:putative protease|nr:U32 family peptidase [Candidatus Delongbacteria bacterium]